MTRTSQSRKVRGHPFPCVSLTIAIGRGVIIEMILVVGFEK
jgi:hypothetical protein